VRRTENAVEGLWRLPEGVLKMEWTGRVWWTIRIPSWSSQEARDGTID